MENFEIFVVRYKLKNFGWNTVNVAAKTASHAEHHARTNMPKKWEILELEARTLEEALGHVSKETIFRALQKVEVAQ